MWNIVKFNLVVRKSIVPVTASQVRKEFDTKFSFSFNFVAAISYVILTMFLDILASITPFFATSQRC